MKVFGVQETLSLLLASTKQRRNKGAREAQCPGRQATGAAESLAGRRKDPNISQKLFSIQHICFLKTLGSNTGAPNLLLAPGAI